MNKATVKNKKILILGGLGFIGRNLAAQLLRLGASVTLADHQLKDRSKKRVSKIENLSLIKLDILDRDSVERIVQKRYDIVFNLAAHSGPKASLDYPFLDLNINVFGALNVLEAVKKTKGTVLIFMGSRLEYGSQKRLPVREDAKILPQNFYGVNKFTAGVYHVLYNKLYNTPTVVFRGANPFGPHIYNPSPSYNIVNFFIDKAIADEEITVFENAASDLKDYIYIDDFCDAMIKASVDDKVYGEIFNLGSGVGIKLIDAARSITKIVGKGAIKTKPISTNLVKIESGDFIADITKIKKMLKWKPETTFNQGIEKTIHSLEDNNSLLSQILHI